MNGKLKIIFWIFFLLSLLAISFVKLDGQELLPSRLIEIESANLTQVVLVTQPQWELLDKVEDCKEMLKNSPPLEFVESRGTLIRKQIALCILNIETGDIFEKRYWLENKDIDKANDLRGNYLPNPNNLPRFSPVNPTDDFEIINVRWNSWNSNWNIEVPNSKSDIYVVLGDKYSVSNSPYIIYPEEKTGPKYSDITYAPYSEGVHDAEAVQKGRDYINQKVDAVFDELRNLNVMSRAFPGKLVVDTMSKEFVKSILLVEQTDPDAILNKAKTDEEKRKVAEIVLVRYALNGDKTFRYTMSSAGALGPAQIMAATGNSIFKSYPAANLIKDINIARVDMGNAIKVQILVFDDHLSEVIEKVNNSGSRARQVFNGLTEDQLDEVRGMIYNGGASKYNLATGGINMRMPKAEETLGFIQKLRVIRYLKLFN